MKKLIQKVAGEIAFQSLTYLMIYIQRVRLYKARDWYKGEDALLWEGIYMELERSDTYPVAGMDEYALMHTKVKCISASDDGYLEVYLDV